MEDKKQNWAAYDYGAILCMCVYLKHCCFLACVFVHQRLAAANQQVIVLGRREACVCEVIYISL